MIVPGGTHHHHHHHRRRRRVCVVLVSRVYVDVCRAHDVYRYVLGHRARRASRGRRGERERACVNRVGVTLARARWVDVVARE